jgi:hypothetical protein
MPKLWIVHRNPRQRAALARLAGLDPHEVATGAPREEEFRDEPAPAAVLLGLEADFELELEFAHRMRIRLPTSSWILLAETRDASEAARLFGGIEPEILDPLPSARLLRARIAAALARRTAASLAERQRRSRIAERFSAWLGGVEIPGLLRALDPSLTRLPLLVRGVPGSGRSLICHYVELFRGGDSPTLRLFGGDVRDAEDLARRLGTVDPRAAAPDPIVIWIDEVDRLPASAQHALAEWILHGVIPGASGGEPLRWIATAGPSSWQDPLEPGLQQAFTPLVIEVPALADHPETLPAFAEEVARDWARSVGGAPRRFAASALAELEGQTWEGDRAQVEAVLRATLAATRADPIEAEDLVSGKLPEASSRTPETIDDAQPEPDEHEPGIEQELASQAEAEEEPEDAVQPEPEDGLDESVFLSEASFALSEMAEPQHEPEWTPEPEPTTTRYPTTLQNGGSDGWRRLARSLSHEIRNPLVSIRTFAELLPEHYQDETFRERFVELVGQDVAHIGEVISRLSSVAERDRLEAVAFDVSAMIESLLEQRRERIQKQRLLVLRELERDAPLAWADPTAIEAALAGLIDRALASLPERGDLFVATRHLAREAEGASRLRILLRHHSPELARDGDVDLEDLAPSAHILEYVLAQTVVESSGGSFTIDSTDARETLILVDLPTPL